MTAYTASQVAAMPGVSVRALHFYDEIALLNPATPGRTAIAGLKRLLEATA